MRTSLQPGGMAFGPGPWRSPWIPCVFAGGQESYGGSTVQFIAARDFRTRPCAVWKRLKDTGELVVTSKGKPIALLRDVGGRDIEEEIRTGVMARGLAALRRIRETARRTGVSAMTGRQIDALVAETRRSWHSD